MAIEIRSDTDPAEAAKNQVPSLVASQYREANLKEYLLACGGTEGLTIVCTPNAETARIEQHQNEQAPSIYIPARDFEQPASDYPQEVANRLMQYGLALHEHGHDRYTAGAYLTEKFDRLQLQRPSLESFYWSLVNMIEDNRIETALIQQEGEWALRRLQFVYANFIRTAANDCENPDSITWASALQVASCHYGKGREQSNLLPTLLDEDDHRLQWRSDTDKHVYNWVVPELRSVLDTAAAEPNGKEAAQIELEFVKSLDKLIAQLTPPPRDRKQEESMNEAGGDKKNDMGSSKADAESLEPADNNGQDSASGSTSAPNEDSDKEQTSTERDADNNPHTDQSETPSEGDGVSEEEAAQDTDQNEKPSKHGTGASGQGSEQNKPPEPDGRGESGQNKGSEASQLGDEGDSGQQEDADITDEEVRRRERRRAAAEERKVERDREQLKRELKRLQTVTESGSGSVNQIELVDQTDRPLNHETWSRIETKSQQLTGPLRAALRRTQQTNEQRGTRSGRLDSSLSRRLAINNLNVNKRSTAGEQREYTVIVVLDRSVSMRGQIEEAEVAAGGFVSALETIGVTTALVELYQDTARMVKPFQSPVESRRAAVANGAVGGSTPLTDALVLSRERVKHGNHYPFLLVISDGLPNDKEAYLSELSATQFPVVGVNIASEGRAGREFDEYYNICRRADPTNVGEVLSNLTREIVF